jgi:hypothetical protein
MIDSDVRSIRVGSTDADVWFTITDKAGADVTALEPEVRTVSPAGVVSDWSTPVPVQRPTTDVIRSRIEVTPAAEDVGWWEIEARLDGEVLALGGYHVVP